MQACEALGAGEILLNCIDMDGQNAGFDTALITKMKESVSIPVIASSGAGKPEHFIDVFHMTNADAGLAAGIFHRRYRSIVLCSCCMLALPFTLHLGKDRWPFEVTEGAMSDGGVSEERR